jgi:hypothetical protein
MLITAMYGYNQLQYENDDLRDKLKSYEMLQQKLPTNDRRASVIPLNRPRRMR